MATGRGVAEGAAEGVGLGQPPRSSASRSRPESSERLSEAEALHRRALKIDEASYGPESLDVACDHNNLGVLLKCINRPGEAEPLFRLALAVGEKSYGADHPTIVTMRENLSALEAPLGRGTEQGKTLRPATHGRRPRATPEEAKTLIPATYGRRPRDASERRKIVARIEDHYSSETKERGPSYGLSYDGKDQTFEAMRHWQDPVERSQSLRSRRKSLIDDNPTSA
jgi:hypothetical protein